MDLMYILNSECLYAGEFLVLWGPLNEQALAVKLGLYSSIVDGFLVPCDADDGTRLAADTVSTTREITIRRQNDW
jgi:hypothetical protein